MLKLFHTFVVPFMMGFVLTIAKLIVDQRELDTEEMNNLALDLVLVGIGSLTAVVVTHPTDNWQVPIDACVGDALLAAILLYVRYQRYKERVSLYLAGEEIRRVSHAFGFFEFSLGVLSIVWSLKAV